MNACTVFRNLVSRRTKQARKQEIKKINKIQEFTMSKKTLITLTVLGSVLLGSMMSHKKKEEKMMVKLQKKLGKTMDSVRGFLHKI